MTKLTDEDKENIGFIFQDEITKNRAEAKCRNITGEITDESLEWHLNHAKYLEEVWECLAKILNKN